MKIIYLIAGVYRPAGMERVLSMKARWWADEGHEVVIVTTDQRGQAPVFGLEKYRRIDLGINYESTNGAGFVKKALSYVCKHRLHRKRLTALLRDEKADVVVSMFNNDADFVPLIKDGSRKILEVHFSRFKKLQYGRRGLWALADRWRSRREVCNASRFERFVVLTNEDKGYWDADYAKAGLESNIVCIPNARTFVVDKPASPQNRQVLAVGRYSHQKGFDMLLRAWDMVMRNPDVSDWKLRIAGSGGCLGGVPESVITGPSDDMEAEYRSSSVFALSSRYEGLPMVLLEAQSFGLPIVSFACKCGPKDVVTDGVDGFLVPELDVEALAAALLRMIRDEDLRRRMGGAAFRNSARYDEKNIRAQWRELFDMILNG